MRGKLAALCAVGLAMGVSPEVAHAHLMVAQRGTLNMVEDGTFFVVSVPVSALNGVDDNLDGKLGNAELKQHYTELSAQILEGFRLSDASGPLPVQGLLLNLSHDHGSAGDATGQLIAMGRFDPAAPDSSLWLDASLFGRKEGEQTLQIKVTRAEQVELLSFSREQQRSAVLLTPWDALHHNLWLGVGHFLVGLTTWLPGHSG